MAKRICRTSAGSVWGDWTSLGNRSANCRTRTNGREIDDAARSRKKSIEHLSDEEKRRIVAELEPSYSVRRVCQVLSVNRSTLYYQPVEVDIDAEQELKQAIDKIAGEFPR